MSRETSSESPPAGGRPSEVGRKRRRARRFGIAGAVAILAFGVVDRRWFTMNDITTGATPEYPELQSRVYAADVPTARSAARAACESLPRWRVVSAPEAEELHVEVRTFPIPFTDDVTVRFDPLPDPSPGPQTRVVIRSHSRVGKGDLGENARHIAALQAAMDTRLPPAR